MRIPIIYIVAYLFINTNCNVIPENYTKQRNALLEQETQIAVGGNIQLNEDEIIANNILMQWKHNELDPSLTNPKYFNFSKHYFTYKNDIPQSKVYKIIKSMPKGAVLHVHSSLMLHSNVLMKLTYIDNLYACFNNESLRVHFAESTPIVPCSTEWRLVSELRNSSGDAASFDAQLENYFTLYNDKGEEYNNVDLNTAWKRFDEVYATIKPLVSYRPAREKYLYETLKHYYEDNVYYIEIRTGIHGLYELDGSKRDKKYFVELYKRVTNQFIQKYPDFIGIKLILTSHRSKSVEQVLEAIDMTIKLKTEFPDMIAGFDLVGQEELGKPLTDFLPILAASRNKIDYYLHAGETAWQGTSTDENLVDAIVLGSKRIGHGYALTKHPILMYAIFKNSIALEVNVISNVVLSLVHDVRNHPLASYLAMGLPVVLSSDDPGAWSSEPLSHDFFVTFMGVASKSADLRMLKQLAINSITYSALVCEAKTKLFNVFQNRWNQFIKDLISNRSFNSVNVLKDEDTV